MHKIKTFYLTCGACGSHYGGLREWINGPKTCVACDSPEIYVEYEGITEIVEQIFANRGGDFSERLFQALPVHDRANMLPQPREYISLERWKFLENVASQRGIRCTVYAHRFDNSPATGTVKDLAGHLSGSVYKEQGVKAIVVASTGNIAVAMSRFFAAAGIDLLAFLPKGTSKLNVSEVACYGQSVVVIDGDYSAAKKVAAEVSARRNIYLSPNGWDPIRIEAKKTIAYEWQEMLGRLPSVYIQALSGGMGPLGIQKGVRELKAAGLVEDSPRYVLVQTDKCNPMTSAWKNAVTNDFYPGWERDYPTIVNPETKVTTISTGDPKLYPILAPIVKSSGGEIIDFPEDALELIGRAVAERAFVRVGPASAVAVGGFFQAINRKAIRTGDCVVISIGEGARRAPDFFERIASGRFMKPEDAAALVPATVKPEMVDLKSIFNRLDSYGTADLMPSRGN